MEFKDVTVFVFAYNQESFIVECLESIAAQTAADRVHLVVHDDASTDDTVANAKRYLASSGLSWQIIESKSNRYSSGIGFFLSELLSCSTPFTALCDADDAWISEDKIERQLELMTGDPSIAISHHSFVPYLQKSSKFLASFSNSVSIKNFDELSFLKSNNLAACTVMFRNSFLRGHADWRGYEKLRVPDYPIWGVLALYGKIIHVANLKSKYRLLPNSFGSSLNYKRLMEGTLYIRRWLWWQYMQSGKVKLTSLEIAWKKLSLDFASSASCWTGNFASQFRWKVIYPLLGSLKLSTIWQVQSMVQKVRRRLKPVFWK